MAVRVRILPQWLADLRTGDNHLDKKANGLKNHRKTPVKNGTALHKRETSEEKNDTSKHIVETVNTNRSEENVTQKKNKLSPGQRNSKTSRVRLAMSSSDEEDDVKPSLTSLKAEDNRENDDISKPVADAIGTDRSERDVTQRNSKLSPGQREKNSKTTSGVRLVMSSSDEEDDVKPCSLKCSKEEDNGVKDIEVSLKVEPPVVSSETKIIIGSNVNLKSDTDAETTRIEDTPQVSTSNEDQDVDDGQLSNGMNSVADGSNKIVRPICKYGQSCYRKNSQHRQDFSHPGDDDYTTVDNRPECEYGLSCYRKNYLHRQHYKHTKKVQKQRKAKRQKKQDDVSGSDDEDYDLDDPFMDDASSDDYLPTDDSETDFSAEEVVSGNDDADQSSKDTKKLQRKRKH